MNGIISFLERIIEFLSGMIQTLIDFITLVGRSMVYLITIIGSLPDYFKLAVLPIISISIVLFLLNRG